MLFPCLIQYIRVNSDICRVFLDVLVKYRKIYQSLLHLLTLSRFKGCLNLRVYNVMD